MFEKKRKLSKEVFFVFVGGSLKFFILNIFEMEVAKPVVSRQF